MGVFFKVAFAFLQLTLLFRYAGVLVSVFGLAIVDKCKKYDIRKTRAVKFFYGKYYRQQFKTWLLSVDETISKTIWFEQAEITNLDESIAEIEIKTKFKFTIYKLLMQNIPSLVIQILIVPVI